MLNSPLERVAADIRTIRALANDKTPIYIGRKPDSDSSFISIARGASQGILYGFGGLAYLYTSIEITIRHIDYENMESLLMDVVSALLLRSNYWITSFSPVQTVRSGGSAVETIEMSLTLDTMEKI